MTAPQKLLEQLKLQTRKFCCQTTNIGFVTVWSVVFILMLHSYRSLDSFECFSSEVRSSTKPVNRIKTDRLDGFTRISRSNCHIIQASVRGLYQNIAIITIPNTNDRLHICLPKSGTVLAGMLSHSTVESQSQHQQWTTKVVSDGTCSPEPLQTQKSG